MSQQFAYNEASFVLVRMLQVFDLFTVAQAKSAPVGSLPPDVWKLSKGRKSIEEVHPQSSTTLYSKVRCRKVTCLEDNALITCF